MRQHQRDGLRMFAFQELAELRRIHLLQRGKVAHLVVAHARDIAQQLFRALAAEGLRQQARCVIGPAAQDVLLRFEQPVELHQHGRLLLRADVADARELFRQPLNLVLAQLPQQQLGRVFAQRHDEDGRFAQRMESSAEAGPALQRPTQRR